MKVHAGRHIDLAKRIHRLAGGLGDIDEALVRAHLELLARLLVDVRPAVHGVLLDPRGQRHRAVHLGTRALSGLHDVQGSSIEHLVIVGFHANSNLVHESSPTPRETAPEALGPSVEILSTERSRASTRADATPRATPPGDPRATTDASARRENRARSPSTGLAEPCRARPEERLPPEEEVGVFLSGGIDSSVVTAEVARQRPGKVHTYALHFGPKYANELSFAAAVADACGCHHHEVELKPRDFIGRLREIIWHLDDPIGDPVTVPNYEMAQHVGQRFPGMFNGEGGDPCFGGPKNIPLLLEHFYGGLHRDGRFRERAYVRSFRRAYEDLPRLLTPGWQAQFDADQALFAPLTPFFETERPPQFLDKLTAMNIRLKGAHLILPKIERMQGAFQVTPLSPLFAEDLIRFSFAMPPSLKLASGVEKGVLKRAYQDTLPKEVIDRPKSGMRVPVHYWLRKDMRRYAKKILSKRSLQEAGIFDADRVAQHLRYDIEEGQGRYGLRLWMLITFEIWRRIVIDGEPV